jgi:hypothetical protein
MCVCVVCCALLSIPNLHVHQAVVLLRDITDARVQQLVRTDQALTVTAVDRDYQATQAARNARQIDFKVTSQQGYCIYTILCMHVCMQLLQVRPAMYCCT